LKSPRVTANPAERTLLKNLGSWLGNLTLARNKPLIHKKLALKVSLYSSYLPLQEEANEHLFFFFYIFLHIKQQELIVEAYETGKLIALIPFTAKVLEACAKSKIFAPPNVWVMAIMRLISEIYQIPELKLNLKFEIELLCSHLGLDLSGMLGSDTGGAHKLTGPHQQK